MSMFEITPLHFSIGKGWFSNQQGFCLELDFFTTNIILRNPYKSFWGSLIGIYIDIWKEDGEWNHEISGDFLYLAQFLRKKQEPVSAVL